MKYLTVVAGSNVGLGWGRYEVINKRTYRLIEFGGNTELAGNHVALELHGLVFDEINNVVKKAQTSIRRGARKLSPKYSWEKNNELYHKKNFKINVYEDEVEEEFEEVKYPELNSNGEVWA